MVEVCEASKAVRISLAKFALNDLFLVHHMETHKVDILSILRSSQVRASVNKSAHICLTYFCVMFYVPGQIRHTRKRLLP